MNAEFDNIFTGTIDRTAGRWGNNDDIPIYFGSSQDSRIEFNADQTNDALMITVDGVSRSIIICEEADAATNFAIAVQTNPTLFIHSADAGTAADYISFTHDQTDSVINSGAGGILLQVGGTTRATINSTGLVIDQTSTSGIGVNISRNLASGSTDNAIVRIFNDHATDDQPNLLIDSDITAAIVGGNVLFRYTTTNAIALGFHSTGTFLRLNARDFGANVAGCLVSVDRNSNATPAAGSVNYMDRAGTNGYVWQDAAGNLRIFTTQPTTAASDTVGTVIGTQTSTRESKADIEPFGEFEQSLNAILETPIYGFRRKNEIQAGIDHRHIGFIADERPEWMMYDGNSTDYYRITMDLVASVKALSARLEAKQLENPA